MVFHTSNRKITYPNLKINNINIERVTQFNFLGGMFNSHMDWSRHINYISMKISRSTGILYRLKDIYPQSVLLTLYNTLILPHFHYCLLLWGSTVKDNHPLHLLQKKQCELLIIVKVRVARWCSRLRVSPLLHLSRFGMKPESNKLIFWTTIVFINMDSFEVAFIL